MPLVARGSEESGSAWGTRKWERDPTVHSPLAKVWLHWVWELPGYLIGSTHKSPHHLLGIRLGGTSCESGLVLGESWTQE